MTTQFVSYAQNYEDVVLWRALKHVTDGFYIDVGAYSPDEDSVTKAFYERGWRGINIEPNPELHRQLLAARPRDVNLNIALADRRGHLTMHFVSNAGLSTLDAREAEERVREGHTVIVEDVRVETLEAIWAEHVGQGQPVHFLKVDVEGFELQVLLAWNWHAHRPWVVVVEATRPVTTEPTQGAWEHILEGAGYSFAYADGLNRFYVSAEHRELRSSLAIPPNVFDAFVRASEADAVSRAAAAEALAAGIQESRSWQMTRPLRAAASLARRIRGQAG